MIKNRLRSSRLTKSFNFKKRFKLKYLFSRRGLNFSKTSLMFDFLLLKSKKWKRERGLYKNISQYITFKNNYIKRFNIFHSYGRLNNYKFNLKNKIFIVNRYNLRKKNFIIHRLGVFFFLKSKKLLKKKILGLFKSSFYKRSIYKYGTLNSRLDLVLYNLGIFKSILDVYKYLNNNFIYINNVRKLKLNKNYFLNNDDFVRLNFRNCSLTSKTIVFNKRFKSFFYYSNIKQSSYFLIYNQMKRYRILHGGFAPYYPVNLKSFTFIFLKYEEEFLLNFYIDFFEILKFLKYGR